MRISNGGLIAESQPCTPRHTLSVTRRASSRILYTSQTGVQWPQLHHPQLDNPISTHNAAVLTQWNSALAMHNAIKDCTVTQTMRTLLYTRSWPIQAGTVLSYGQSSVYCRYSRAVRL